LLWFSCIRYGQLLFRPVGTADMISFSLPLVELCFGSSSLSHFYSIILHLPNTSSAVLIIAPFNSLHSKLILLLIVLWPRYLFLYINSICSLLLINLP
jgi:hypothetical protein